MIYGYARVSTKGQAKDGNSLEAQEKALKEASRLDRINPSSPDYSIILNYLEPSSLQSI